MSFGRLAGLHRSFVFRYMILNVSKTLETQLSRMIRSIANNEIQCTELISAVSVLLGGNISANIESESETISMSDFQRILASLNEKESRSKSNGVFYSPKDVTDYITYNAFYNFVNADNCAMHNVDDCFDFFMNVPLSKAKQLLRSNTFDPTCGNGEFIVSAFELKLRLLKSRFSDISDVDILNLVISLNANDIAKSAIDISKVRIFVLAAAELKNFRYAKKIAEQLNSSFTCYDFLIFNNLHFNQYDIILGNPPYVEYRQLPLRPKNDFGNSYADVLVNSSSLLSSKGVMAFIIPLSFVSTQRMKKVRDSLTHQVTKQIVLNFADRPDCLFTSVHQKLTIYIGCKAKSKQVILSSGYHYWYKSERNDLFNDIEIVPAAESPYFIIPKLGNELELSIYKKVLRANPKQEQSFLDFLNLTGSSKIYLNMRGCFWMKAFTFNPGSKEYREFKFDKTIAPYLLCLINSSLFFFYWIAVSDCWHITSKELKSFKVETVSDNLLKEFKALSEQLENALESTKVYVGTKQIEYEYKHKDCKCVIDKIDTLLQTVYGLTDEELNYIINYNLKYRTSNGK